MKCSLLTLSSFIDGELETRKRGEVEAHLVGCRRCASGLEHLREEVTRVGALAHVRIPDHSVADLLEQLNLIDAGASLPPRTNATAVVEADDNVRPWMDANVGAALPWRSDAPARTPYPAPASLGSVPWTPSPPPTPSQGDQPWEGGTPPRAPADDGDDSGEASVELSGAVQASAEPEDGSVPGNENNGETAAPGVSDSPVPADETPPPSSWTSAAHWTNVDSPNGGGWYPPTPPTPRPGPTPVAPPVPPSPPLTVVPLPPAVDVPAAAQITFDDLTPPHHIPKDLPAPAAAAAPEVGAVAPDLDTVTPPGDVVAAPMSGNPEEGSVMPTSMIPPVDLDYPDDVHVQHSEEMPVFAPPQRLPRASTGIGIIDRIRDRIALQRALHMHRDDFDDSVEIVSGTGAPQRAGHAGATPQPVAHSEPEHDVASAPSIAQPEFTQPEFTQIADLGNTSYGAPPPPPPFVEAPSWAQPVASPARPFDDFAGIDGDVDGPLPYEGDGFEAAGTPVAHFPSDAVSSRLDDVEPLQALREDALRRHGLDRPASRPSRPTVSGAAAMTAMAAAAATARHAAGRAVGSSTALLARTPLARFDIRARIALGLAALLLLGGLVLGRHSAPLATTSPSSSQPTGQGGSAAPPATTKLVPAPVVPAPQQPATAVTISGQVALGGSATGISVSDVRYGVHPNDFRIVFDLSGAGAPHTVVGMLDANTVVVIMDGTTSPATFAAPPAGGTVTSITTMPSAVAGQTIIKISLAHAVTHTQGFLSGPLRLVLDLS